MAIGKGAITGGRFDEVHALQSELAERLQAGPGEAAQHATGVTPTAQHSTMIGPSNLAMHGDVIIEFGGKPVDEPYNLRNIVAGTLPGTEVEMKVIRNGETKTFKVTIEELSTGEQKIPTEFKNALKGVSVQNRHRISTGS